MYRHKQIGWTILMFLIAGIFVSGVAEVVFLQQAIPAAAVSYSVMATLALAALAFHSLTVTVDHRTIDVLFGFGWIRFSYPLSEVISCEAVRNPWWWGWGIKYAFGSGWLFNVSGLDAVEIILRNGKKRRIGTDEPEVLAREITNRMKEAARS